MNFSQIPGQKEVIETLLQTVKESRISHAQLFTGPEGCGSLAMALAYAKYVSCENKQEHDSCGTCKSCVKYEKLVHPDLHFVFPVVKKGSDDTISSNYLAQWRKMVITSPYFTLNSWLNTIDAGNSQGIISVLEAGDIVKQLSLKSFESEYKIMIIWLPEKMHPAAANKLLKIIEEPPEKTLFLLVSNEPDKILTTIFSRCQLLRIPRFSEEELSLYLEKEYSISGDKAKSIAHVSNGNIIRTNELAVASDSSSIDHLNRFKSIMRFAWKRDVLGVVSWSDEMSGIGREAQKDFLSYGLRLIRENLMLNLGQQENNLVYLTDEEKSFANNFCPFINERNVYSLVKEFNLAYSHIEANGNAKIVFLDLGLNIVKLILR